MNAPGSGTEGCAMHGRVCDELRAVAELFADRMQPWLDRMAQNVAARRSTAGEAPREAPGETAGEVRAACTWCPLCGLVAALRGDRPDVITRLADHAGGLVAATRELLTPPAEPTPNGDRHGRQAPSRGSVQHIVVHPAARDADRAARDEDSTTEC